MEGINKVRNIHGVSSLAVRKYLHDTDNGIERVRFTKRRTLKHYYHAVDVTYNNKTGWIHLCRFDELSKVDGVIHLEGHKL